MSNDYTFVLRGKQKRRYNAGPYDAKTGKPFYSAEISAPPQVAHLVTEKQFLVETAGGFLWCWDFENQSDSLLPAFVIVKKDGQLVPCENSP
jgi:hypothetical protein